VSAAPSAPSAPFDPIRFCIFTTIALVAWCVGPPAAVALMSGLGLWAYWHAWRSGLRESKCFLRDPRLVMLYLGAAFLAGAGVAIRSLVLWLSSAGPRG
jgi:hypothetical protein